MQIASCKTGLYQHTSCKASQPVRDKLLISTYQSRLSGNAHCITSHIAASHQVNSVHLCLIGCQTMLPHHCCALCIHTQHAPMCQAAEALGITLPNQSSRKRKLEVASTAGASAKPATQPVTTGALQLAAGQPALKKPRNAAAMLPPLPSMTRDV